VTPSAPSITAKASERSARLTVVIVSYLIFIALGMNDGMVGVAFAAMRVEFGLSLDAFGLIFIASTIGFLASSFLVGRLLDTFRTSQFLIAAGLLRTLGMLGFTLLPTWWAIIAATLLIGFASGMLDAGMNTWFAMRFSPRLMSWLHASFGLGATIGPIVLASLLTAGFSWRWGYALMATAQILVVVIVFATRSLWQIAPSVVAPVDNSPTPRAKITAWQTLLLPAVWLGIAVFFFYTGVELTASNWAFSIFTESRGVSLAAAGFWTSAFWATFTAGRIFFGFVAVRSLANLLRTVMVGAFVGALMFAWAPVPLVGFLGLAFMGFCLAPVFPLLVSETPQRLGADVAQHAIGFQVGAASLGIAVLPSLAGVLAERTSLESVPLFIIGVSVVLILLHEWMVRTAKH
jgi:fucose permease